LALGQWEIISKLMTHIFWFGAICHRPLYLIRYLG
jgi:hypothetical protein